ncbi:MAG TPA: type II toxin-antitoxin system RelE/ParE family toxin [Candidatus Hodarchaeales archaeon]|nr:type II toxin-antitoxin system RelE/ParE family toxin [Candidatus Hodarchaeales archaeon]
MSYQVIVSSKVEKFLLSLSNKEFRQIKDAIASMSSDPRQGSALTGQLKGLWSWRTGNYRIIYEILDQSLRVLVVRIGTRKRVYSR